MSQADTYRQMATDLEGASAVHLTNLDPDKPSDKVLLGILGAIKAAVFTATADILDAMPAGQRESMATRNQRLRMASLRGDDTTVQKILDDAVNEAMANDGGT